MKGYRTFRSEIRLQSSVIACNRKKADLLLFLSSVVGTVRDQHKLEPLRNC